MMKSKDAQKPPEFGQFPIMSAVAKGNLGLT